MKLVLMKLGCLYKKYPKQKKSKGREDNIGYWISVTTKLGKQYWIQKCIAMLLLRATLCPHVHLILPY